MPPPPVSAPVPVPALVPPPPMRLSRLCLAGPAPPAPLVPVPPVMAPTSVASVPLSSAPPAFMCQEGRRAEGQTGIRKGAKAKQLQKKLEVSKKIVLSEDPEHPKAMKVSSSALLVVAYLQ